MAWTLCSKQDVIELTPITENELKDSWSDEVEGLIRQHIHQPYLGSTAAIVDEYHDGDGTYNLKVSAPPIISVEDLTVNEVALTEEDYVVLSSYISLKSRAFPIGHLNIKVSYTSGSLTVDPVVRLAAASMIVAIINYRKRSGADSSIKWSAAEQQGGEKSPNYNVGLTSHLQAIMKRLLKRPVLMVK